MAGIALTKDQINQVVGQIALDFADWSGRVADIKAYLDRTSEADLVALGFTSPEVTLLKSAMLHASQISAVARGGNQAQTPTDFTVFLSRLWGFGRK